MPPSPLTTMRRISASRICRSLSSLARFLACLVGFLCASSCTGSAARSRQRAQSESLSNLHQAAERRRLAASSMHVRQCGPLRDLACCTDCWRASPPPRISTHRPAAAHPALGHPTLPSPSARPQRPPAQLALPDARLPGSPPPPLAAFAAHPPTCASSLVAAACSSDARIGNYQNCRVSAAFGRGRRLVSGFATTADPPQRPNHRTSSPSSLNHCL